ncbi:hypothetical protein Ae406Ps2_1612c [Pseudonocardia sp. Ae406_Ps2]|nr:hypothetical protein Ae406Ps2_1612c [Pseudonocardia sp. Ae406_Ps2]OLM06596.1 hypothetical protein Ae331Ps2_4306 [Pseudonocardia sp. Ae331_Ps2]OLM13343.1 hypothetical protein Ae505Ps2_3471 [Pseudonocardia sp. Ae505_Ps2]OLM13348.1 hypothetical protein Ae505Ps2_3476 [Pseudonocardia sp. Ae505_Ps2]OLM23183.1 hypothetical protein Ae706Ps2_1616c [Pseudonocardia sp. Ae706_Ps2]
MEVLTEVGSFLFEQHEITEVPWAKSVRGADGQAVEPRRGRDSGIAASVFLPVEVAL